MMGIVSRSGWFREQLPDGELNRRAIGYCCQVIMAMLQTGRHLDVPLSPGSRMSDKGKLPDLDQALVFSYIAPLFRTTC